MAQDVKLIKDTSGYYDLDFTNGDIASVSGLETAIIISLCTYARANISDNPEAFKRGGWCGNMLTKQNNYELGSLLWTLVSRINQDVINRAENIVRIALNWMIVDEIVDSITVEAVQSGERSLRISIDLYKKFNTIGRFSMVWGATRAVE